MTKDQWIQKAKALLFDYSHTGDVFPGLAKESAELVEQAGGFDHMRETAKTPLRWRVDP